MTSIAPAIPRLPDRYVVFQLAEVAVPRALFAAILHRIDRVRGPPAAAAWRERAMAAASVRNETP